MKSIYKMGIPVSGRNIFPSNIQGLPTWYLLRISEKKYLARVDEFDILINLDKSVLLEDLKKIKKGGLILSDQTLPKEYTDRFKIIQLPVQEVLEKAESPKNLNLYLVNMVYVGVLSALINLDLSLVEETLYQHFNYVEKAYRPNIEVVRVAYQSVLDQQVKSCPYQLKKRNLNEGQIVIDGNKAAALGALFGGIEFSAWYPITPATELSESLNEYNHQLRDDPESGKATCVVIQAEDELAAIGMAIGAAWAGLRSMTSTSGPGLSLMAEYIGLAYQCEVPVVIWDVQRVGPSTGLPTRTSQGDLTFSYFLSHGDKDYVILLPGNVQECFEFGWRALDIAEQIQSPVIVLSDLELGMNLWVTPQFQYPDKPIERGKILWEKGVEEILQKTNGKWGRYVDMDGDGIPYRTLPGNVNPKAAYFTRGTGHDEFANYSEDSEVWKKEHDRLKRKFRKALELDPLPTLERDKQSKIGFISYGSTHFATEEACDLLLENGIDVDYLRIRSIPLQKTVELFLQQHERLYVVEANRDGQMAQILMLNFPKMAGKVRKLACGNGLGLTAKWIVDNFSNEEGGHGCYA